ncbi:DUF5071 domain-containing protein [Oceanicola sp. D3]|uniref:DUF5071 domain-containing protein n=1 Tax=Oceanicola sp. D3 TaxID=2587163 RepID=UPI00111CEDAA|nr:DUF5071 domain-containing protein [Oceanicola sp. D3]QDC10399.1 DUF5071 domain-containing protein [Oceanicola sp. D3]
MDLSACIPRDKHDTDAVQRAAAAIRAEPRKIAPVLPELLEWLQDANWPVAKPLAACLRNAGPELLPPLRRILNGKDGPWKYWVIELLAAQLPPDLLAGVRPDLARLARAPTTNDRIEEVHLAARAVLAAASA